MSPSRARSRGSDRSAGPSVPPAVEALRFAQLVGKRLHGPRSLFHDVGAKHVEAPGEGVHITNLGAESTLEPIEPDAGEHAPIAHCAGAADASTRPNALSSWPSAVPPSGASANTTAKRRRSNGSRMACAANCRVSGMNHGACRAPGPARATAAYCSNSASIKAPLEG